MALVLITISTIWKPNRGTSRTRCLSPSAGASSDWQSPHAGR